MVADRQNGGPIDLQDRNALEAFAMDTAGLRGVEELISEFNLFEALGIVRQETRHSNLLAFLLDPSQTHGLGDVFLKRFLKRIVFDAEDPPLSVVDVECADLRAATVRREWQHVDLLIHDAANRLVCGIENKVDSGEHSDQLRRYRRAIDREFPDHRKLFVLLAKGGVNPSDDHYQPMSYDTLSELVDGLLGDGAVRMGSDLRHFIEHYATTLRRHLVSDSEIAELCRQIYGRHKRALDLIFEHRPDLQAELFETLKSWLREDGSQKLIPEVSVKSYIRFAVRAWDAFPAQRSCPGWTHSGRMMIFEFWNTPDKLGFWLQLGPGPQVMREALFEFASSQPDVFRGRNSQLTKDFTILFKIDLIRPDEHEGVDDAEELAAIARPRWERFLEKDLPAINQAFGEMEWPEASTGHKP